MIIKYKLQDGKVPVNIKDGGYFPIGDYLIGIGEPVEQKVLTKEELKNYIFQGTKDEYKEKTIEVLEEWLKEKNI